MEDIFNELKQRCEAAGTTLAKVCEEANVNTSTVWNWKKKFPVQIGIFRKLERVIESKRNGSSTAVSE